MEKAIKNKVAKAVVPAIDVMFQAMRFVSQGFRAKEDLHSGSSLRDFCVAHLSFLCFLLFFFISEFGAKVVPPKRILKMLPELFDHQDQNVRASSKGLTLELCRWIGKDPVKSILFEKMRDTMVILLCIFSLL